MFTDAKKETISIIAKIHGLLYKETSEGKIYLMDDKKHGVHLDYVDDAIYVTLCIDNTLFAQYCHSHNAYDCLDTFRLGRIVLNAIGIAEEQERHDKKQYLRSLAYLELMSLNHEHFCNIFAEFMNEYITSSLIKDVKVTAIKEIEPKFKLLSFSFFSDGQEYDLNLTVRTNSGKSDMYGQNYKSLLEVYQLCRKNEDGSRDIIQEETAKGDETLTPYIIGICMRLIIKLSTMQKEKEKINEAMLLSGNK